MSYTMSLTKGEEKRLKELLSATDQSKILKRYQCIHFKNQGLPNKQIAALLCVNIDTITDWIKLFKQKGLHVRGVGADDWRRVS